MIQTRVGAFARQKLWQMITAGAGGLVITGAPPKTPGIIVANHTSHADTAILFASFKSKHRPVAVAAKDYWLTKWYRRLAVRSVMAIVPVERTKDQAYEKLLEAVKEKIDAGQHVILYPEGTRTVTGEVGTFKTGAVRLAQDLQVPLYPVAIKGVQEIFPKNGKFKRGRMEVVFGQPVRIPQDASRTVIKNLAHFVRGIVVGMKNNDVPRRK